MASTFHDPQTLLSTTEPSGPFQIVRFVVKTLLFETFPAVLWVSKVVSIQEIVKHMSFLMLDIVANKSQREQVFKR